MIEVYRHKWLVNWIVIEVCYTRVHKMFNQEEAIEILKGILENVAKPTENLMPRRLKGSYELKFDRLKKNKSSALIHEMVLE